MGEKNYWEGKNLGWEGGGGQKTLFEGDAVKESQKNFGGLTKKNLGGGGFEFAKWPKPEKSIAFT